MGGLEYPAEVPLHLRKVIAARQQHPSGEYRSLKPSVLATVIVKLGMEMMFILLPKVKDDALTRQRVKFSQQVEEGARQTNKLQQEADNRKREFRRAKTEKELPRLRKQLERAQEKAAAEAIKLQRLAHGGVPNSDPLQKEVQQHRIDPDFSWSVYDGSVCEIKRFLVKEGDPPQKSSAEHIPLQEYLPTSTHPKHYQVREGFKLHKEYGPFHDAANYATNVLVYRKPADARCGVGVNMYTQVPVKSVAGIAAPNAPHPIYTGIAEHLHHTLEAALDENPQTMTAVEITRGICAFSENCKCHPACNVKRCEDCRKKCESSIGVSFCLMRWMAQTVPPLMWWLKPLGDALGGREMTVGEYIRCIGRAWITEQQYTRDEAAASGTNTASNMAQFSKHGSRKEIPATLKL